MSEETKHNHAAFGRGDNRNGGAPGLTKREYFAAMAMQGFASSDTDGLIDTPSLARMAVNQADALIAELNKSN